MKTNPEDNLLRAILETPDWIAARENLHREAGRKLRHRRAWRVLRPTLAVMVIAGVVAIFTAPREEDRTNSEVVSLWTEADWTISEADERRFPL